MNFHLKNLLILYVIGGAFSAFSVAMLRILGSVLFLEDFDSLTNEIIYTVLQQLLIIGIAVTGLISGFMLIYNLNKAKLPLIAYLLLSTPLILEPWLIYSFQTGCSIIVTTLLLDSDYMSLMSNILGSNVNIILNVPPELFDTEMKQKMTAIPDPHFGVNIVPAIAYGIYYKLSKSGSK